ncbi:MAG: hypothetical protein HQ453_08100 [Actinobacteria bacterium]|nr:hypothetical protein [Actinomycetota bacterium]
MEDLGQTAKTPEFYADAFQIASSTWGVDLIFGRNFEEGVGLREPRAAIAMSPQLAEELGAQLTKIAKLRSEGVGATTPGPAEIGNLS